VRSLSTNHFFDSGNVIFDENIPYHALHEVSSTPKDYSSLPFPATVLDTVTPTVPISHDDVSVTSPPSADPLPLPPFEASSTSSLPVLCTQRKLTVIGHDYAETIAAAKAHLQKLCSNAERWRQLKGTQEHTALATVEEGIPEEEGIPSLCRKGGLGDFPDSFGETDDFAAAVASLDVDDYLQRDADGIFETALLSLRSDVVRDPRSPGYNVTTPPANHCEAMMCHDAEEWKKVEDKELEMLKSMGVYVDENLPEGRKAIGNCWVFEFKLDVDGGLPIYKARLVTQGFLKSLLSIMTRPSRPLPSLSVCGSLLFTLLFMAGTWSASMQLGLFSGGTSLTPSTCDIHLDTHLQKVSEAYGDC
jgi:hypothetical protein